MRRDGVPPGAGSTSVGWGLGLTCMFPASWGWSESKSKKYIFSFCKKCMKERDRPETESGQGSGTTSLRDGPPDWAGPTGWNSVQTSLEYPRPRGPIRQPPLGKRLWSWEVEDPEKAGLKITRSSGSESSGDELSGPSGLTTALGLSTSDVRSLVAEFGCGSLTCKQICSGSTNQLQAGPRQTLGPQAGQRPRLRGSFHPGAGW